MAKEGARSDPNPFVRITFRITVPAGTPPFDLRINVACASPAFYVSPSGGTGAVVPLRDLDGLVRSARPSRGAYER